jgi:hypothetical protein
MLGTGKGVRNLFSDQAGKGLTAAQAAMLIALAQAL